MWDSTANGKVTIQQRRMDALKIGRKIYQFYLFSLFFSYKTQFWFFFLNQRCSGVNTTPIWQWMIWSSQMSTQTNSAPFCIFFNTQAGKKQKHGGKGHFSQGEEMDCGCEGPGDSSCQRTYRKQEKEADSQALKTAVFGACDHSRLGCSVPHTAGHREGRSWADGWPVFTMEGSAFPPHYRGLTWRRTDTARFSLGPTGPW